MKKSIFITIAAMLLSGCSLFYDAPLLDADYGKAQSKAWENQVAFADYRYAGTTPEGLGGIPAEQIMKVYNQSFGEKPKSAEQDFYSFGVTGDN